MCFYIIQQTFFQVAMITVYQRPIFLFEKGLQKFLEERRSQPSEQRKANAVTNRLVISPLGNG